MTTSSLRKAAAVAAAATLTLGLAACGSDDKPAEKTSSSSAASSSAESSSAESSSASASDQATAQFLEFRDAYVGAKGEGESMDMTGVFGELVNTTDEPIHLVKVTGSLPATYQIHQVVDGKMSENPNGLTIPAKGTATLKPGGDHLMIMDYKPALKAGETITLTVTDDKGRSQELKDIPVRVQQSSHEHYGDAMSSAPGASAEMSGHEGHEGHGQ